MISIFIKRKKIIIFPLVAHFTYFPILKFSRMEHISIVFLKLTEFNYLNILNHSEKVKQIL